MVAPTPNRFRTGDLKSRLLKNSFTSVYQVKLTPPQSVNDYLRDIGFNYNQPVGGGLDIELRCSDAMLPGTSLATHDSKDDYMGVSEKMAYRRMYDDTFDIVFYVDSEYNVIEMFEGWIDFISGMKQLNQSNDYRLSPYGSYRFAYPDEYKSREISITKFEKDINPNSDEATTALEYKFVNAFPLTITSTPVSYQESDILRYNVRFSYQRYVRNRVKYKLDFDVNGDYSARKVG